MSCSMTSDPIALFSNWFEEAKASEPNDHNAMALATSGADSLPHVRMVLLKGHGPEGFTFYTNQESDKARQISERPFAALLFHWKSLRRQVRLEGKLWAVSDAEADAYFATRGRDSQLGAWASDQSRPLDERATLEARFEAMKARYDGADVPRPPHWSGYRLDPARIEFWEDRPHRLHHRRLFTASSPGNWSEGLLYP
jgi:pyridoxamine 5'-phosphate oxidase